MDRLRYWGSALIAAVLMAIVGVIGWTWYQKYQFDYANHTAMVQIIQYNLQQGRLMPIPQAQPQPQPTPQPAQAVPSSPDPPVPK